MKEPTSRQLEVLSFIAEYIHAHAYPPTIRELADNFEISVKGAHDHVIALRKKGFLKQGDKKSRTMELVNKFPEEDRNFMEIPILGTVAAGKPILSEENCDGAIKLPRTMVKKKNGYFALRVRGDSMEGAGIMDGDVAVIEQQNTARNGDIVVVTMDEAVTLKTFYKESSRIRLQPANPKYPPIYCREVKIQGKLAHIIRSYENPL